MARNLTRDIDLDGLALVLKERGATARHITAIAGPPAAGKSTRADALAEALNADDPGSAAVLQMDGYHLDDHILVPAGLRPRKGAPETFDVGGFAAMLRRLADNQEDQIAVPVFDRDIEIARAGARWIPQTVRHLIVEGNWLLLNEHPWSALHPLFGTTVFVGVSIEEIKKRLAARWAHLAPDAFRAKIDGNDLPNAEKTLNHSVFAEFTLRQ